MFAPAILWWEFIVRVVVVPVLLLRAVQRCSEPHERRGQHARLWRSYLAATLVILTDGVGCIALSIERQIESLPQALIGRFYGRGMAQGQLTRLRAASGRSVEGWEVRTRFSRTTAQSG